MYIPQFVVGVICGIVGVIIFEMVLCILTAPTIEDEKEEKDVDE